MNEELVQFLDKFYSKYAPDTQLDSTRRAGLLKYLEQDFEGTTRKMYEKYAPDAYNPDNISKLKDIYFQPQEQQQVAPATEEPLPMMEQLAKGVKNYFTADLPGNFMKGVASLFEDVEKKEADDSDADFYTRLAEMEKTNPELYQQYAAEFPDFVPKVKEIQQVVAKSDSPEDVKKYINSEKLIAEHMYNYATDVTEGADRTGIVDKFSEITDTSTFVMAALNNAAQFGAQMVSNMATGGLSMVAQVYGDVFSEVVEKNKAKGMSTREAMEAENALATTAIAGSVGILEKFGLDNVLPSGVKKVVRNKIANTLVNILYGTARGAAVEGSTESLQEGIQDVGTMFATGASPEEVIEHIQSPEFLNRVKEAGFAGLTGGGVLGGAGGGFRGITQKQSDEIGDQIDQKVESRKQATEEANEKLGVIDETVEEMSTGESAVDNTIDQQTNKELADIIKFREKQKENEQKAEKTSSKSDEKVSEKPKQKRAGTKDTKSKSKEKGTTEGTTVSRETDVEEVDARFDPGTKITKGIESGKAIQTAREKRRAGAAKKKEEAKPVEVKEPAPPVAKEKTPKEKVRETRGRALKFETEEEQAYATDDGKVTDRGKIKARRDEYRRDERTKSSIETQIENIDNEDSPTKRMGRLETLLDKYKGKYPEQTKVAQKRLEEAQQEIKAREEEAAERKALKEKKAARIAKEEEGEGNAKKFSKKGQAGKVAKWTRDEANMLSDIVVAQKRGEPVEQLVKKYNDYRAKEQDKKPLPLEKLRLDRDFIQEKVQGKLEERARADRKEKRSTDKAKKEATPAKMRPSKEAEKATQEALEREKAEEVKKALGDDAFKDLQDEFGEAFWDRPDFSEKTTSLEEYGEMLDAVSDEHGTTYNEFLRYVAKKRLQKEATVHNTVKEQQTAIDKLLKNKPKVAETLKELVKFLGRVNEQMGKPPVQLVFTKDPSIDYGGYYNTFKETNRTVIVINLSTKGTQANVIHEYIHPFTRLFVAAATANADNRKVLGEFNLRAKRILKSARKAISEAAKNVADGHVVSPLEQAVAKYGITPNNLPYGLTNESEMYSEAFSDIQFMELLSKIRAVTVSGAIDGKPKSIFQRLVDSILDLVKGLGIKTKGTLLQDLINDASKLENAIREGKIDLEATARRDKFNTKNNIKFKRGKGKPINKKVVNRIAESLYSDPNINYKKDIKAHVDKLNEQLTEEDRITTKEINAIWEAFQRVRGTSENRSRMQALVDLIDPSKYTIKESGVKKQKKLDKDVFRKVEAIYHAFKKNRNVAEVTQKMAALLDGKTEEDLTPELQTEIELLQFSAFSQQTEEIQKRLLLEAIALVTEGKTKRQQQIEARQAEVEEMRTKVLEVLNAQLDKRIEKQKRKISRTKNKKKIKEQQLELNRMLDLKNNTIGVSGNKGRGNIKTLLNTTGVAHDSFDTLMDYFSRNDKTGTFKSYLNKQFGDRVAQANQNTESGKAKLFAQLQGAMDRIFNIKQSGLSKQITALRREKVINQRKKTVMLSWKNDKGIEQLKATTRDELTKKWMEFQDETLKEQLEKEGYNGTFLGEVEALLTEQDIEWAKAQLKFYDNYFNEINKVYRDAFGIDMPKVKNYSPVSRDVEGKGEDELAKMLVGGTPLSTVVNAHLKSRVGGTAKITWGGADHVMSTYISKMEHFRNFASIISDLNAVFKEKNSAIQNNIRQQHGGEYSLKMLYSFIDDLSRGGAAYEVFNGAWERVRARFGIGVLSANFTLLPKQLSSILAYASEMPAGSYIKYMLKFFLNPAQNRRMMLDTQLLQNRLNTGNTRDVSIALGKNNAENLAGTKKMSDFLMSLVKLGDSGAIVWGGWAVYQYNYDKAIKAKKSKEEAHKLALREFNLSTRITQQSAFLSDQSYFERHKGITRWFTMFMSSPRAYTAMTNTMLRRMYARMTNDGMKALTQSELTRLAARAGIYTFGLPAFFILASQGFQTGLGGDEEEDLKNKKKSAYLKKTLAGYFGGLYMAGPVVQWLANIWAGENFEYALSPVETTVKDVGKIVKAFVDMDEWSMDDLGDAVSSLDREFMNVTSKVTGIGIAPAVRQAKGIKEYIEKDNVSWTRLLGYSPYMVPSERKRMLEEEKYGTNSAGSTSRGRRSRRRSTRRRRR